MKNQSQKNHTPIQLKMPVEMEKMIEGDDPVYSFNEVLSHIGLKRYFVEEEHKTGRPTYDKEKLLNLNCIHGALLRMNRSIQAEGVFGGIKWNRSYTRARRRGLDGLILETALISCGFNLHKFHLKALARQLAA